MKTEDLGLVVLRATTGGFIAGHGAQKLFGWFGGPGLEGTAGWLESMKLRPSRIWALGAGLTELGGGTLTALGALNPIGPLMMLAPMSTAVGKVHWGKPIWVTKGGAELPITNMAVAVALVLTGPGQLSVDHLLRFRLPRWITALCAGCIAIGVAWTLGVTESNDVQQEERLLDPSNRIGDDELSGDSRQASSHSSLAIDTLRSQPHVSSSV